MRIVLAALVAGGVLLTTAPTARAQLLGGGGGACSAARQPARDSLAQASQFNPWSYGPLGWATLTPPFGPDPWGAGMVFGALSPTPTYGPLGPGLTANTIAAFAQANDTFDDSLLLDLASQQQTELGTLLSRYSLGASYLTASSIWGIGYATRASASRTILQNLCRGQRLRGAAGAASATPSGSASQPAAPARASDGQGVQP